MAAEYRIRELRATGRTPEAVSIDLEAILNEESADGWALDRIQPIIYNSSTTGYLLAIFTREAGQASAP